MLAAALGERGLGRLVADNPGRVEVLEHAGLPQRLVHRVLRELRHLQRGVDRELHGERPLDVLEHMHPFEVVRLLFDGMPAQPRGEAQGPLTAVAEIEPNDELHASGLPPGSAAMSARIASAGAREIVNSRL